MPFDACEFRDTHIEIESRLSAVEQSVHDLKSRLQEYDVSGLKSVVADLTKEIAVLRTKLWFYQMGATAAGGLIVILLERSLR
jgi:hypothetical protein